MPSRKQRRRRDKERRHAYELVYVDPEGREVEPPPETERRAERSNGAARASKATQRGGGGGRQPRRVPQPPSWSRSGKRALMFFPLFLLAMWLISKNTPLASRLIGAAAYSLLFVPLTYLMDRTAYRTYVRRTGGAPPAASQPRQKRR